MAAGVIRELGPDDRSYYTRDDVMLLLGIGSTKASSIMSNFRRKLKEKGKIEDDYPERRVPKMYFDKAYAIKTK